MKKAFKTKEQHVKRKGCRETTARGRLNIETIVKMNKTKSWFFENINKIGKPLARHIREKERRIKSTKLEMKKKTLQSTMQKYKGL